MKGQTTRDTICATERQFGIQTRFSVYWTTEYGVQSSEMPFHFLMLSAQFFSAGIQNVAVLVLGRRKPPK